MKYYCFHVFINIRHFGIGALHYFTMIERNIVKRIFVKMSTGSRAKSHECSSMSGRLWLNIVMKLRNFLKIIIYGCVGKGDV